MLQSWSLLHCIVRMKNPSLRCGLLSKFFDHLLLLDNFACYSISIKWVSEWVSQSLIQSLIQWRQNQWNVTVPLDGVSHWLKTCISSFYLMKCSVTRLQCHGKQSSAFQLISALVVARYILDDVSHSCGQPGTLFTGTVGMWGSCRYARATWRSCFPMTLLLILSPYWWSGGHPTHKLHLVKDNTTCCVSEYFRSESVLEGRHCILITLRQATVMVFRFARVCCDVVLSFGYLLKLLSILLI